MLHNKVYIYYVLLQGHGEYAELYDEKEFFEVSKKSENIACLFYKDDSPRCKIVDHHFKILAKKHIEARFCKLNVERCPFLTGIVVRDIFLRYILAIVYLNVVIMYIYALQNGYESKLYLQLR